MAWHLAVQNYGTSAKISVEVRCLFYDASVLTDELYERNEVRWVEGMRNDEPARLLAISDDAAPQERRGAARHNGGVRG